jgi:hypothetical protein
MEAGAEAADTVIKGFGAGVTIFAGYLFLRVAPYRRYKAEHLRTDRFALHVFGFALASYAISVLVASVIDRKFAGTWFQLNLHKIADSYAHVEAPVLITLVVAIILGAADSLFITFLMRRDPAVVLHRWKKPLTKIRAAAVTRFVLKCDDAATRLLHRATIYRKPLILTLKSGKVYVGQPAGSIGDPSVRAHSIKLIPLVSGYRNAETQKVELPTKYKDVYQKMVLREKKEPNRPEDPLAKDLADLTCTDGSTFETDMQDIGIVVLWSEVLSMSLYDENIYRAFQDAAPPEKTERTWLGKDGIIAKTVALLG